MAKKANRPRFFPLDAGRNFEVPMPLASMRKDLVQQMIGRGWTEEDFATLLLQQAQASG